MKEETIQSPLKSIIRKTSQSVNIIDLAGKKFRKLTVIERVPDWISKRTGKRKLLWKCVCDCGKVVVKFGTHLKSGEALSCGCSRIRHGELVDENRSSLYQAFFGMHERCYKPKSQTYANYGARGITICDRWFNKYLFIADMKPTWKPGLSLDRIDNSAGYSPENCRWASTKTQSRNKRNTILITIGDKTLCLKDWTQITGIKYTTALGRINKGWDKVKAVTQKAAMRRASTH